MSNPFEMVHINAERDKEAKRQALRNRDNKITVVDFGKRDNGYLRSYPIEDEVQAISKCAGFRTYLTASENMIAQAERDTLSHVSRKGFPNRATYEKEICYTYILEGVEVTEYETIILHDTDVITSQIQARVGSYGVKNMTKLDIYGILNTVSRVFMACETIGIDKPAVYANTFKKSA